MIRVCLDKRDRGSKIGNGNVCRWKEGVIKAKKEEGMCWLVIWERWVYVKRIRETELSRGIWPQIVGRKGEVKKEEKEGKEDESCEVWSRLFPRDIFVNTNRVNYSNKP